MQNMGARRRKEMKGQVAGVERNEGSEGGSEEEEEESYGLTAVWSKGD
jgi:hypothetical protein